VPDFVNDAIAVSRKTYQYALLDSGLQDREALERTYRATANQGWFRSYILYAEEKPVAFQVGHVYRGRYHAQDIGYDPEWARHHVGIFLHTEIVTDLAAPGEAVTCFDFGIGDTRHKQRLSTDSVTGGYFYLIPDTWRGSLMAHSMRVTNSASAAIGAVLDRFGLRQKTRQLLRRLGAAK
jgi:CelD/BcsL family acetyltransferase involved in cellulose biosynthesis